jgi:hypothetical protein
MAAVSTVVTADLGEVGAGQGGGVPGTPESGGAALPVESVGQIETITTDSTVYDPTILTKFISGLGFVPFQGAGVDADFISVSGDTCVFPSASPGSFTTLFAPVELPDGARIKQLAFFGDDNAVADIEVRLLRNQITVPPAPGTPTRTELSVGPFSTAGSSGVVALSGPDNLEEVTGSFQPSSVIGTNHRFHFVEVIMNTAALANHILCGVEVRYQVPMSSLDPGTVFHPITPVRAYDSRIAAYALNGPISNNSSRVIDISAGHDLATGAVTLADAVPPGATAITYNLTSVPSTTSGFVAVTPGNADMYATSSLNLNGTALANGGTVAIAGDRTIKVHVGGGGATQVIVDVTGYYTAPVPAPNMGN